MSSNRFWGIVCAVAMSPAALFAAEPPKGQARHKKQEVEITGVPQTQLTKPAAPPKDKKGGPVLTIDEFISEKQGKILAITDRQINQMNRLIRITDKDDPQKADFYFRLAELFAEKQRYHNFQARALEQKIFDAPPQQKASLRQEQQREDAESQKWLYKAVENYVEASRFKKYDKMDEVLFRLAYLLSMVKKEEQAREFFHRLIKDYPNSKYVPFAYLSFAEYFFANGDMNAALKFYSKVEEFKKSSVYGYAVYKKGWCQINLGNFKEALTIFVDVIRLCRDGVIDKKQRGPLEREAKKDVVRAYARVPGASADRAWDFFRNVGGDFAPKMYEALGELYWEQGMFGESTKVYHKLMSMNAGSPRLCEWQNKVVRNTLSAGNKRDQVKEIARLGTVYDRTKTNAATKKDQMAECKNAYHDTTKELALIWHKEAQKTKNPDTYQLTKDVYKEYMRNFSNEKGAVDMAFYYGEVLWVTENWREAAEQYTKVVEMAPKGKHVKEAAYAAVLAWKNALNIDDSGAGPDKAKDDGKDLKPKPIPEYQKKMIAAFDTYIKYVPESDMVVKIKYRKARIYYDYNHFDEAIKLYKDIVDNHVKDELAIYSANLLLDSLNIMGRTAEVVTLAEKFLNTPELMKDPEFQKQMVMLKTDTYVVEAKKAEQAGNFKECGISMVAAADSLPDHPKHAERLYNAGLCFTNARLIGQAIKAREQLIKDHPKDPLAQRALYQIAAGYQQIAYYSEAAKRYEEFATKFPGEKEASQALGNAYVFRIGLGDFEKAVEDMNAYIKYWGARRPQDAANKYFQLSEVYEKQNKSDELVKHFNDYLKRFGKNGGVDKQIIAHFKLGELAWKKSCPVEQQNGACLKIERVTSSGKQKALYDINKKIKDKRKKLRSVRTQCGPPTSSKITVVDRNKTQARQAQSHFATALKLWNNGAAASRITGSNAQEQQQRIGFAGFAAAGAAFYTAEQSYEQFLKVKFPEGLDFQAPTQYDSKRRAAQKKQKLAESTKKFGSYINEKGKLAVKLANPDASGRGLYNRILDFKQAHWTIAASARIGQVYANFVDQLYTAEIPKDLKEVDEWGLRPREIFCDALVDKAEPIEKKAVEGYDMCLKAATQESWFNEWSTMCEVELNQMQPSEYPLSAEAKPEPGYSPSLITPPAVPRELPSSIAAVGQAKQ